MATDAEQEDAVDKMLTNEITVPMESWNKLSKHCKSEKMQVFSARYAEGMQLDGGERELLQKYLFECLDKNKLQRVKDVNYDKTTGSLTEIYGLQYFKTTRHFTIRNHEKRTSTTKGLPISSLKNRAAKTRDLDSDEDDEIDS